MAYENSFGRRLWKLPSTYRKELGADIVQGDSDDGSEGSSEAETPAPPPQPQPPVAQSAQNMVVQGSEMSDEVKWYIGQFALFWQQDVAPIKHRMNQFEFTVNNLKREREYRVPELPLQRGTRP